jgi:TP901 family phage tail tape measure protein
MADQFIDFQLRVTAPSSANLSAVQKQIQSQLNNVKVDFALNGGRQAQRDLAGIANESKKAKKETISFGEAVGIAGKNFVAYSSAVTVVGRLAFAMSRATRDAIKFEREFVKLAQVFNVNVGTLGKLQSTISDLSKEYGLAANVIAKTSVILAQSGLTVRETEAALRALTKTTLASTFGNIAATTEAAVAIIAQFEEGAKSLERQLGAVNAVSKTFAVESQDIAEAVTRAGGAFQAAGGNFEEFIALFTAVRSTTRETAETISTGFRTIFARLQRAKTITFFKNLGIQLQTVDGQFVGPLQAVRNLTEGLDRLGIRAGSIKFAQVVEQLGGIRQVSRVIPLLQQRAKIEKALQVARAGGASLDRDVAKAQETLAQSLARTTQNFSALIREITQTDSFQTIANTALAMANAFIETARAIKPLIPLIATFAAFKLSNVLGVALKTGFSPKTVGTRRPIERNSGGIVPGSGDSDTVPAMLTPGEFVIRVRKIWRGLISMLKVDQLV